jgi:hypothetical protein
MNWWFRKGVACNGGLVPAPVLLKMVAARGWKGTDQDISIRYESARRIEEAEKVGDCLV